MAVTMPVYAGARSRLYRDSTLNVPGNMGVYGGTLRAVDQRMPSIRSASSAPRAHDRDYIGLDRRRPGHAIDRKSNKNHVNKKA